MANEYKDVLRAEYTEAGVTGVIRNKQSMFANDTFRMVHKFADGTYKYWSPDSDLSITARQVTYTNASYDISITNVWEALDALTYETPTVTSFTANPTELYEKGQTVAIPDLEWVYNKLVDSQAMKDQTGTVNPLDVDARQSFFTGANLSSDTTYTLYGIDDKGVTGTSTLTYRFKLNKYYGTSASATPNETIVEAGTATLSIDTTTSKTLSTVNIAGGGNYIYYAYPASWGALNNLYANGFKSTWNLTTVSVSNGYSNTENYYVYTSPNTIAGTISLSAN